VAQTTELLKTIQGMLQEIKDVRTNQGKMDTNQAKMEDRIHANNEKSEVV
jgi:hypothetical protein